MKIVNTILQNNLIIVNSEQNSGANMSLPGLGQHNSVGINFFLNNRNRKGQLVNIII